MLATARAAACRVVSKSVFYPFEVNEDKIATLIVHLRSSNVDEAFYQNFIFYRSGKKYKIDESVGSACPIRYIRATNEFIVGWLSQRYGTEMNLQ